MSIAPGQAASSSKVEPEYASANVIMCAAAWEGRQIALSIPVLLDEHEVCAANVSLLLKTFKESTATIFRFCLLEKRVLFLGRSAPAWLTSKMVTASCIPLVFVVIHRLPFTLMQVIIASSMVGAARRHVLHSTFPYASLVDTSFLTVAGYIAGVAKKMMTMMMMPTVMMAMIMMMA